MPGGLSTIHYETLMDGGEERIYLCGVDDDGVEFAELISDHDGISYVDHSDESHGEKNNDFVRASGVKRLIYWKEKENEESVGDFTVDRRLLISRTLLISRKGCRISEDYSSGISYILVRGNKSMCVVSRDKSQSQDIVLDLDNILARHQGYFMEGLDMEPFAAATLTLDSGNKPVGWFPGAEKAMVFLSDTLRSNLAFTDEKTVQTSISALAYLYGEALKAKEIEVRVFKAWSLEKESLEVGEIEEHLSSVQGHEHPCKLQCTEKMKGLRSQQA